MEPPAWGWLGSPGLGIVLGIAFQTIPGLLPDERSLRADCRQFMDESRKRRAGLVVNLLRGAERATLNNDPTILTDVCDRYVVSGDSLFERSRVAARCSHTFHTLHVSSFLILAACAVAILLASIAPATRTVVMVFGFIAIALLVGVSYWKLRLLGQINGLLDGLIRDHATT